MAKYGKYLNNNNGGTKNQQQHHHQQHNLSRATRITAGYSSSQDSGRDSGRDSSVREIMSSSSNPNNASSEEENNINNHLPYQDNQEENFVAGSGRRRMRGGGEGEDVGDADDGRGGHISAGTSFDSDSALTEGRHCNLFSEKQGSLYHPPASREYQRSLHQAKQIRINSSNRMANEAVASSTTALHKTSIPAISGAGGGGGGGDGGGLGYFDKSSMETNTLGSGNSLHHNLYTNDSYESRFGNDHRPLQHQQYPHQHHHHHRNNNNNSMSASSTFLLDDGSEMEMESGKSYLVPLDIPTPPPQPHMPHGRPTQQLQQQQQSSVCQCDTIGNNGAGLCHHQQHFQQVSQLRHQHNGTAPANNNSNNDFKNMETPLANGLSHHHPHRPHHTSGLLNYKLHDPQQLHQFTTPSPHQHHQHQHQHHDHHALESNFGQHHHHAKLGSQKSLTKLQLHQKQQQLQNLVYPQLSPCHVAGERNSFHRMDDLKGGYAKKVRAKWKGIGGKGWEGREGEGRRGEQW